MAQVSLPQQDVTMFLPWTQTSSNTPEKHICGEAGRRKGLLATGADPVPVWPGVMNSAEQRPSPKPG
ncbi:unnamed protein product [Boreogadus saida]